MWHPSHLPDRRHALRGDRGDAIRQLVAEINRDNDVDFVMHAGDIKAGSERCNDVLITHRFALYQTFQRPFVYTPGDNEWTDCHRLNNGQYNPLERLAFLRSVFFPQVGQTTGGQVRPVRSQAANGPYSEFVENVMFKKQSVMFATVHVVGSNNDLEPWLGIDPTDSCITPRPIEPTISSGARMPRSPGSTKSLLAAASAKGLFLLIQANPYNLPSDPLKCPSGFNAFLDTPRNAGAAIPQTRLARPWRRPLFLRGSASAPNLLFSRVQTFGETKVHWVKVHMDPKSSGVFSIEQKIVRS